MQKRELKVISYTSQKVSRSWVCKCHSCFLLFSFRIFSFWMYIFRRKNDVTAPTFLSTNLAESISRYLLFCSVFVNLFFAIMSLLWASDWDLMSTAMEKCLRNSSFYTRMHGGARLTASRRFRQILMRLLVLKPGAFT